MQIMQYKFQILGREGPTMIAGVFNLVYSDATFSLLVVQQAHRRIIVSLQH